MKSSTKYLREDVNNPKRRTISLEGNMTDVLVEQRLLRHAMVDCLDNLMHIEPRLEDQVS